VVDFSAAASPTLSVPLLDRADVDEQIARFWVSVTRKLGPSPVDNAGIAHLAAGLSVERRLVDDHRTASPAFGFRRSLPSRTSAWTTPSACSVS
jgi:hypothetical protein